MRKTMVFGSMVLSLLMLAPYALADQGGKHGPGGTHGKETHMKVSGVVSKVESKYITVKTTWGFLVITSDTSSKNLEVGEEVEMTVNENNTVIDVHRKETGPRASFRHRQVGLCWEDEEGDQALDTGR